MKAVINLIACAMFACAFAVIAGCASQDTKRYDAYIQLYKDNQAAAEQQKKDTQAMYAALGAKCAGDACVTQVALTAALASGVGGGQAQAPMPAPPQEEPSFWRQAGLTLLNGNLVGTAINGAIQWHSSDNQAKTQIEQYHFLSAAVGDMKSNINVGGNYVPGTYYAGGYIGGGVSGTGAGIGNSGNGTTATTVSGTGNGTNGSNVDNSHDNRTTSPGPFNNSGNGGNCSSGGTTGTTSGSGAGGTCPGNGGG